VVVADDGAVVADGVSISFGTYPLYSSQDLMPRIMFGMIFVYLSPVPSLKSSL
jgi:hypothetical protein